MEVIVPIEKDSDNTYVHDTLKVSVRGDKALITIGERTLTVNKAELLYALNQPSGQ